MIDQPKYSGDRHGYYTPISQEAITVNETVKMPTIPNANVRMGKVYFRGNPIRVTFDGNDPVGATTGVPFYDGYEEFFSYLELSAMKMTRDGTSNGEVHIVYYR
jgi:hypothetical protein